MTDAQIIQMARDAGSIDSDETILTVYSAIRSATKEEDAGICESESVHVVYPGGRSYNMALEKAAKSIRASK